MKAVELTELPEATITDDSLIPVVNPDGTGRATLKEVRGLGLNGQETFFLASASTSGVTADSKEWQDVPQATTADKRYLWSYMRFTYTDGKVVTTPPAIVGVYGDTGDKGPKGDKGDTGKPFVIAKTYPSIQAMETGYATDEVDVGAFVVIDTGSVEDPDNGRLYLKGDTAYQFIVDLSGIQGLTGPQGPKGDKGEKGDKGDAGIPIDSALSSTSTNAVQNKAVTAAINNRLGYHTTTMLGGGFVSAAGGYISLQDFWTKLVEKFGRRAEVYFSWSSAQTGYVSLDGTANTNRVSLDGSTIIYNCNNTPNIAWSVFHALVIPGGSITDSYIITAKTSETAGTLSSKRIYTIGGLSIKDTVYVQFRGEKSPQELFGGTWQNISSQHAGCFFRAEGGAAAAFGNQQAGGLPNITGYAEMDVGGIHNNNNQTGALYKHSLRNGFYGDYTTQIGNLGFDAKRSNSLYGAATEVRPINEAIRIWKRTG